mgnify:CR=1 FL=1
MLDSQGRPRRIANVKPHPSALPVEYPDISDVDRITHRVRQAPIRQWDVHDDKVVVSYEIVPIDIERARARLKASVRRRRKAVESSGTVAAGMTIRTDSDSRARLFDLVTAVTADDQAGPFDFEVLPDRWETVDRQSVLAIGKAVNDHIQAAFSRQRELEREIERAEDLYALADVDINQGWPGEG